MVIFTSLWLYCLYFVSNVILTNAVNDDKVPQYTSSMFSEEIGKKNHFVMFYAPWCGHCKRLHPTWEQLAEMLNVGGTEREMTIAKVDCTAEHALCSENDVTGYPTLKLFKEGQTEGVKFRGTRDLPSLSSFINEQLGHGDQENFVVPPTVTDGLIELTDSSFQKHMQEGNVFVKFYAPWCGHCQKLAPTWEELAKSLESDNSVAIAKLDCTVHRSTCVTMDIKGFPTLLWIKDGKVVEKYSGQRGLDDLRSYVRRMLGEREATVAAEAAEEGAVLSLTGDNFSEGVAEGVSFVKFFAPWCGHCKRLAPTWSELGRKVMGRSNVRIVRVDCTQENSKELCNQQEVEGFPTLFLYKNGEKVGEYNGSRNLDDLFEFLSKHLPHDEL